MNIVNRIERILFLVRCMVRAIFYGTAKQTPKNISKIIVALDGKLGDVVCGTPVLYAIRKYLPNTHVVVAGNIKLHRALLSDSGLVDEYIDLGEKGTLAKIKKHNAEVALITGPSFTAVALLYLSGIPLVIAPRIEGGFSPSETKPYKILQRFIKIFPFKMGEYAPRERLRALEPLGIFSSDTKKHLGFSKIAGGRTEQFFVDSRIDIKKDLVVGISPSAGSKIKNWGEEKFAQLADYIYKEYNAKIVIVGSGRDKEEVDGMTSFLNKNTKIINTMSAFSIDELKALISKMNIFISVDTGPIYIAEAFGVATIDIVGPVDDREQPPIGERNKVVKVKNRIPEIHIMNAGSYNRVEARRQTDEISVSMVVEKFNELM